MNRDRDFLVDIIDLIDTIQRNLPDTEKEFLEDEVLLTANIHWVQTIGEAANAVSEVVDLSTPGFHGERSWTCETCSNAR